MIVLVPTRMEMQRIFPELGEPPRDRRVVTWQSPASGRPSVDVAWCGFGLAAAGAGAAAILASRSDDACLVGLAGTLQPDALGIGHALVGSAVECHGLGLPPLPSGSQFDALLAADPSLAAPESPATPAELLAACGPRDAVGSILSVAIPSASRDEAQSRGALQPTCLVEEMEAFAVLHAATVLRRSLTIIRGVSNIAGERDKSAWRVDEAAEALRGILDRFVAGDRAS